MFFRSDMLNSFAMVFSMHSLKESIVYPHSAKRDSDVIFHFFFVHCCLVKFPTQYILACLHFRMFIWGK